MRLQTAATLGFVAFLFCASTVVIAGNIAEDATHAPWLPDPDRTPGSINPAITQANIGETICHHGAWSTKTSEPSVSYLATLKRQQLEQYGYTDKNPRHYEEDHLIPLEIGENPTNPKNLWPEPVKRKWGAQVKDNLK